MFSDASRDAEQRKLLDSINQQESAAQVADRLEYTRPKIVQTSGKASAG